MAKIITKRQDIKGEKIHYESWPKEQARLEVSGMYRDRITKQRTVKSSNRHGQRWTHGFGTTS